MISVVRVSDGLGNQMFQYAFARKIKEITGNDVYLDVRFINNEDRVARGEKDQFLTYNAHRVYGLNHYKTTLPIASEGLLSKWDYISCNKYVYRVFTKYTRGGLGFWQYKSELSNTRNEIIRSFENPFPTYYEGYFANLEYYNDIRLILQKEFRLRVPFNLPGEIQRILNCENTVSLHIRRGDFIKLHRDISEKMYYLEAIKTIKRSIAEPIFLIFSDDIEWVKRNLKIEEEKVYISGNGFADYVEFAIMKHCKHHIIANSTFSYWAAFLNSNADKIVICPKRWKSPIIPDEWTQI